MNEGPKDFLDRRMEIDARVGDYSNEIHALLANLRHVLKTHRLPRQLEEPLDQWYSKLTPELLKEVQKKPIRTVSERFSLQGKELSAYPADLQEQEVVDEIDRLAGIINTTADPAEFHAARLQLNELIETRKVKYWENHPE